MMKNLSRNVDVFLFVAAADVVYTPFCAILQDSSNCLTVVLYIDPVSDVLSRSIQWKGLHPEGLPNQFGYEFLWMLVRAMVVGM